MKTVIDNTDNYREYPFDKPYVSGLGHVHNGIVNVPQLGENPHVFESLAAADEYINSIGRADILRSVEI